MALQNTFTTVGNTSTQVLAKGSERRRCALVNDSDETMYVSFGEAAVIGSGLRLNRNGGSWSEEYDDVSKEYIKLDIYAITASGGKNLCVFEN